MKFTLPSALLILIFAGCSSYVRSVDPKQFDQLRPGMPESEVLAVLGEPASKGMQADGTINYEYREYRYSWTGGQREQVAVYRVACKDGKLLSYGKSEGANFRPVGSSTYIDNN